ncbi:MAG: helix-turn-helix domain-containing protein [Dehalococcoidia bacterium]
MPTLTQVRRRITAARQLPAEQRRAAAAALLPDVDVVLGDGVQASTAAETWTRLARVIAPRTAAHQDPVAARRIALDLIAGRDPLAALRAARARDDAAQQAATEAREALRAAAVQAVADGARPTVVHEIVGMHRQTVYDWLTAAGIE